MGTMTTDQFLREYELRLAKEFDDDVQWAPGATGPRFWNEEDAVIDLANKVPSPDDDAVRGRSRMSAACSSDERFLAVSINSRLVIYDIDSRTLQADVLGHPFNIASLHFLPWTAQDAAAMSSTAHQLYDASKVRYLLFVQGETESMRHGEEHGISIWRVDAEGHLLDDSTPLPTEKILDDAMRAMSTDLLSHSDIEVAEIDYIRNELFKTLKRVNFQAQQKHRLTLTGSMPSFGSKSISRDGRKCLFIQHWDSTQSGMRPPNELPQIVVWDILGQQEVCRLKGHTDSIMWAGWAADDQAIVTASWDSTFRIWDSENGDVRHTIGPSGGQNWSGAVSPDGQYVVLSGGRPTEVAVYMVATGAKVATLTRPDATHRRGWIRTMSWNPTQDQVVMEDGPRVLLMDTNTGESRTLLEYERPDGGDNQSVQMMCGFARWSQLFWAEEGRLLCVVGSELTIYVYDTLSKHKWRFQRQQGNVAKRWGGKAFYLAKHRTVLSVNGDLKVRYWKL